MRLSAFHRAAAFALLLTGAPVLAAAGGDAPVASSPTLPAAGWNFDRQPAGALPSGWRTIDCGPASGRAWRIVADHQAFSRPQVLAHTAESGPGESLGLALVEGGILPEGELAVRFRFVGGRQAQRAGFVWRYQGPDQFDWVVADSANDAVAVLRTRRGRPKELRSANAIVTPYIWHELRLVFRGRQYTVLLDGEPVLEGRDRRPPAPGAVGLWAGNDSAVRFDDFIVRP